MAGTVSKYYWRCQMAGWGGVLLAQGICCSILGGLFERCIVMVITGLLITHILRNIIVRQEWLRLPLVKGLPGLFLATLFACIGAGIIEDLLCAGLFGKIRVGDQPKGSTRPAGNAKAGTEIEKHAIAVWRG